MIIRRYNCSKAIVLMLSAIIALSSAFSFSVYAEEEKANTADLYDQLFQTSVLLKSGESYYFKNGHKSYYSNDNKAYFPKYNEDDIFIKPDALSRMLDATITYSAKSETFTAVKNGTTATLKLGEDAVYINGEGKYIKDFASYNGKSMSLPAVVTAGALGYDVQISDGIIVLNDTGLLHVDNSLTLDKMSKSIELEQHFTDLPANADGKNYIRGWSFYDWGPADRYVMDVGYTNEDTLHGYAAYMAAVGRSFIGLHSSGTSRITLDKNKSAYEIKFSAKCSEDYAANKPVIVILYYSGDKYIGSDFFKSADDISDKWNNYTVMLENKYFKDRDATSFSVVFGTQFDEKSDKTVAGYLYYGDAEVLSYSAQSRGLLNAISILSKNFRNTVYSIGFEKNETKPGFFDWGMTGRGMIAHRTVTDDGAFEGDSYGEVSALPNSYAGFMSGILPGIETRHNVRVTCYMKCDLDYNANIPTVKANLYRKGAFVGQVNFLSSKQNILGHEWSKMTYTFPYRNWDNNRTEYDQIAIIVGTEAKGVTDSNPAAGNLYIDNIDLEYVIPSTGYAEADFSYDNEYSLYELGNSVVYKPNDAAQLEPYTEICATVRDIDNQVVDEQIKSIDEVVQDGFTFNMSEPGYYATELTAYTVDGDAYTMGSSYAAKVDNYTTTDVVAKTRAFVVTRGKAKPMEERSEFLMISDVAYDQTLVHYVNLLGYSGVRLDMPWGDGAVEKGFNPAQGVYNWDRADRQINLYYDEGFRNIVPLIFGTPKYAVPKKYWDQTSVNVAAKYLYSLYAPEKMEYVTEAMKAFTERYKDKISGIEFYNEPYYGNAKTAFWLDTMENFTEMSLTAAKAVKSVDKDIEFWTAGHLATGAGAQFFGDTMKNEEFKNIIDVVSHHGTYNTTDMFKQVMEANNVTGKKIVNSESYAYSVPTTLGKNKDFRRANMKYLMHMLYEMKQGLNADCFFEIRDVDTNLLEYGINATNYGIVKNFPYLEPLQGASIAFMFNKTVGKEFIFEGEYDFGDVKGVRFKSDGKPMVIFWNTKNKTFAMPDELKNTMTDSSILYDFEGKNVDVNALKAQKVFYLTEVDETKLNSIKYTENAALDPDYKDPYYTAESNKSVVPKLSELDSSLPRIANSANKPFNEKTFELADDIEWHYDDWNWQPRGDGKEAPGHSVRHAVHIDSDGLYMLIDVVDPDFYQKAKTDSVSEIWMGDSIQFAFNTTLATDGSDRMECQLALTDDGVILYKHVSQNIGAMLPNEFTRAGEIMPKRYATVEKTEKGMMYKVFLPTSELFTYAYPGPANYIRLSILVNNTDDDSGSQGYYEWGSGIGAKKTVAPYAIVTLPEVDK